MTVRFYKGFSKRKNSTKIPANSVEHYDVPCTLKEDTVIENPSIILAGYTGSETKTGNPISINNSAEDNALSTFIDMYPIQDLHGYNYPWAGGTNKNLIDLNGVFTSTVSAHTVLLPAGDYYFYIFVENDNYSYNSRASYSTDGLTYTNVTTLGDTVAICDTAMTYNKKKSKVTLYQSAYLQLTLQVNSNVTGQQFYTIITTDGTDYASVPAAPSYASRTTLWSPYANICPIFGRQSVEMTVNGSSFLISFNQTVYGGRTNVMSGGTSVDWDYISSYNGEILPGEWISDRDKYIEGTFPTTGAEVAYKKTATTISTPRHDVPLARGNNTISSSGDRIILTYNTFNFDIGYDYAYIPAFGKYYFLSSPIILTSNQVQYDLEEDYLATHKTAIGSTVAEIIYSSTGYNKNIVDTRMAVRANKAYFNRQTASSSFSSTGCYIVGIINDEASGKNGAASYYLMAQSDLKSLIECLASTDINAQIEQYFTGDWMQFVASCIWIPVSYSDATTFFTGGLITKTRIKVGCTDMLNAGNIEAKGIPITTTLHDFASVSLLIPYKWQDFRDCAPYTSASLYLVGIGDSDININDFYASSNVSIAYRIDCITGDITYKIYNDDGVIVKTVMFNGGVNVVLSNTAIQTGGVLTAVGGMGAATVGLGLSAVTGNIAGVVGSGIAAMSAGASILTSANHRSTSIKGTNQGRSSFADTNFILTLCSLDTEDIDSTNYIAKQGRPVGINQAISNHSGYVQCDNASVDIAGDNSERDVINNYLNTGFYYE